MTEPPGEDAPVVVSLDGALETITLNRPARLNALDGAMKTDLAAAIAAAIARESTRAVILAGAGRAFCAGADLGDLNPERGARYRRWLTELQASWVLPIVRAPKPFVAAVHGPCVGAGFGLAMACDFVVVTPQAYFTAPFVPRVGLPPDTGVAFFLPAVIGLARARAALLLGERITAEQAVEWGLAHRLAEDPERLATASMELARRAGEGAPLAIESTKRLLYGAARGALAELLDAEAGEMALGRASEDHAEAVAAFRERRTPRFQGR